MAGILGRMVLRRLRGTNSEKPSKCERFQHLEKMPWPKNRIEVTILLLSGLLYGLPHTDGTMTSNMIAVFKNKDPLVSIFLAHKWHPYTHTLRLIVVFLIWYMSFVLSAVWDLVGLKSYAFVLNNVIFLPASFVFKIVIGFWIVRLKPYAWLRVLTRYLLVVIVAGLLYGAYAAYEATSDPHQLIWNWLISAAVWEGISLVSFFLSFKRDYARDKLEFEARYPVDGLVCLDDSESSDDIQDSKSDGRGAVVSTV